MHREAIARLDKLADYPLPGNTVHELRLDFRAALAETLVTSKRSEEAFALIEHDVAAFPEDALGHTELGQLHARLGQWDKAATSLSRSLDLNPNVVEPWYCAAAVYLWRGDVVGYRRACAGMLERFAKPGAIPLPAAQKTATTCSLLPDAVSDFAAIERLAERMINSAEKNDPDYRSYALAKGLVEYRGGHYGQAVQWLARYGPQIDGTALDAVAFSALAVAKQQLGDAAAARTALERGKSIMARKLPNPSGEQLFEGDSYIEWIHCQILLREAEKLVKEPATQRG